MKKQVEKEEDSKRDLSQKKSQQKKGILEEQKYSRKKHGIPHDK